MKILSLTHPKITPFTIAVEALYNFCDISNVAWKYNILNNSQIGIKQLFPHRILADIERSLVC